MTKMRFKQGKGDPGGFKQFLRQENIKPEIIVRYVGNRFHVVWNTTYNDSIRILS